MRTAATWDSLRQSLETRRQALSAEIGRYPPPIPACDAQFNHLLDERRLISAELQRLERAAGDGTAIDDFLASAPGEAGDLYARM